MSSIARFRAGMMHRVVALTVCAAGALGQGGGIGPGVTPCEKDGSSYEYTESVAGGVRTVTLNVCPNHYHLTDMELNPNYAVTAGTVTLNMPAEPMV
eukprot:gene8394-7696_t